MPAEGEAGGYFAEADAFPRRAYLKPVRPHPDARTHARAAREKIAADLAHDLSLPVPPALLWTRDDAPPDCESAVVVTLVLYPRQWAWEHVRREQPNDSPAGLALAHVLSGCAPMLAFDTWVAQTDHGDHPSNIVWGWNPSRPSDSRLIFLDFANSLGFNGAWANGAWKNINAAPFPPLLLQNLDREALGEMITRIADFSASVIEEVVRRVPDGHLEGGDKDVLVEGLTGRRSLVAQALRDFLN